MASLLSEHRERIKHQGWLRQLRKSFNGLYCPFDGSPHGSSRNRRKRHSRLYRHAAFQLLGRAACTSRCNVAGKLNSRTEGRDSNRRRFHFAILKPGGFEGRTLPPDNGPGW